MDRRDWNVCWGVNYISYVYVSLGDDDKVINEGGRSAADRASSRVFLQTAHHSLNGTQVPLPLLQASYMVQLN